MNNGCTHELTVRLDWHLQEVALQSTEHCMLTGFQSLVPVQGTVCRRFLLHSKPNRSRLGHIKVLPYSQICKGILLLYCTRDQLEIK